MNMFPNEPVPPVINKVELLKFIKLPSWLALLFYSDNPLGENTFISLKPLS